MPSSPRTPRPPGSPPHRSRPRLLAAGLLALALSCLSPAALAAAPSGTGHGGARAAQPASSQVSAHSSSHAGSPAASPAAVTVSAATLVAKETGVNSINATDTADQVMGTDLGITWDDGQGNVLSAFGDTFGQGFTGPGAGGGDWRSNVLARSADHDLSDGMTFSGMVQDRAGHAGELLSSRKVDNDEMTVIPTAGVSVGSRQYMAYMSVRHWGDPGQWTTNCSGIAYSDNDGATWTKSSAAQWANTDGDDSFQMDAFVHRDGYVYLFGTPDGRFGAAHVARVPEGSVLAKSAYQYWTGSAWAAGADTQAAAIVAGPVAELSVQYNAYAGAWLMTYLDSGTGNVVLRQSASPTGPWSGEQVLASAADYPELYGGFMHPWSSGPDLYFMLSEWGPYNVYLMHAVLTPGHGNLVSDPSFERGGSAWSCTGACGTDKGIGNDYSGANNGWVRHDAGWNDVHQTVSVTPHTTYHLAGWLRTSDNSDNGFFGVRGTDGTVLKEDHYTNLYGWHRLTLDVDSGGASSIVVYGGVWTDNGDIWLQIDDVSLTAAVTSPATAAPEATGAALKSGTGLYPRVVRLAHSGSANGQLLASVVDFDGSGGVGRIYRSTDDGATFAEVGEVHDPATAGGLCCTDLYELPKQIGTMPAGTLLWAASVGQDAANRRMAIDLWQSGDHGATWSQLPACQTAANTGGLWEPELEVDAEGDLVCHYSDETNPGAHSQSLEERFSSDGRTWGPVHPTVAPTAVGLRPGMATVVQRPDGSYYMTYEVCGTGDKYDCAAHFRTSADGANWGPPTDIGPLITTETGQYFSHAPTVAWLNNGTAAGRLVLVGQQFRESSGAISTTSGRTVLVNTENGGGYWFPINAPVAVPGPDGSYCPNYSSALLPSADGTKLLEIATDYVGSVCQPFYATASSQGTQDSTGAGLSTGSTYRAINVISGNCLDVSADSRVVGGNIQQWTCNGLGPQNFAFTQTSAGDFTLKGQNSGLCVSVAGGSTAPGANVDQETCAGSAGQRWQALNQGDGYWTFRNAGSGLCLDVAGGSSAPGANVQQWTCNKLSPQIWKLEPR